MNEAFVSVAEHKAPSGGSITRLPVTPEHSVRTAFWPAPEGSPVRGTVLLCGGYAEFIEKYFETIGELQQRGFAVMTFDWRGQGLSSRLINDDLGFHRGYVASFEDHLNDAGLVLQHLADLQASGAAPGSVLLFAHSMGGNLGLRLAAAHRERFSKLVLSAPMLGLVGFPLWFVRAIAVVYCACGRAEHYAWGSSEFDLDAPDNVVTGDASRYERTLSYLRAQPELLTSGVTWGWVAAACASMRLVTSAKFLRQVSHPVLLFTAGKDLLVGQTAHGKLAKLGAKVKRVLLPEAMHEPLTEVDEIRLKMWAEIDTFIEDLPR